MFTICLLCNSLYVHYRFTVCSLYVQECTGAYHFMVTYLSQYLSTMFTIYSLLVHYSLLCNSLYVHYSSLYVHYMFRGAQVPIILWSHICLSTCLPYVHYIFTTCSLYVHYVIHYMLTIHSLYVHYVVSKCYLAIRRQW